MAHSIPPSLPTSLPPAPKRRVFGEASSARRNIDTVSTNQKKRKLEVLQTPSARFNSSQNGPKGKVGSSQPSHFESEVLEKLTQDMSGLKENNSERDQQWDRPSMKDFDEKRDNLVFQQIEAEEGTLHGGRATVKLFGVTEVCCYKPDLSDAMVTNSFRPDTR